MVQGTVLLPQPMTTGHLKTFGDDVSFSWLYPVVSWISKIKKTFKFYINVCVLNGANSYFC